MLGVLTLILAFFLTACGGPKQARVEVPPPPPISQPSAQPPKPSVSQTEPTEAGDEDISSNEDKETLSIPTDAKPILVETGSASWYGAPYHNRRGSNGEVYNMNAMTAAHRTLPLGSIVRVTNLKTGHSAIVRITDRGPFVTGRIVDLSLAAARKIDVWQPGTATVRLEVLKTPVPLDQGGRWAVQIGAFDQEEAASELADRLARRYHTAKVLRFSSPVGAWWVRVRVLDDNRQRAEEVARDTQTQEGSIFLVRLD
ncbi:MAG: septal ring lytic transglycosylase RlpA family protein [Acidobacteriia bacterium]|nr:septal ring lytic transglycosylase RlpA family protein [Terriglobia bacterium]